MRNRPAARSCSASATTRTKCGFQTAVLGLSGGIDSALTACLAAEALGAENVLGVAMPIALLVRGQRPTTRGPSPRTSASSFTT